MFFLWCLGAGWSPLFSSPIRWPESMWSWGSNPVVPVVLYWTVLDPMNFHRRHVRVLLSSVTWVAHDLGWRVWLTEVYSVVISYILLWSNTSDCLLPPPYVFKIIILIKDNEFCLSFLSWCVSLLLFCHFNFSLAFCSISIHVSFRSIYFGLLYLKDHPT